MLKLKIFDEPVWFDWPDQAGVRLLIRGLSQKEQFDLSARARRKMAVTGAEGTQIVDAYDEAAYIWGHFCAALANWEGIGFDQEKPKREDMLLAIFNHDRLREFVFQKSKELSEKIKLQLEDDLKNSGSSQAG